MAKSQQPGWCPPAHLRPGQIRREAALAVFDDDGVNRRPVIDKRHGTESEPMTRDGYKTRREALRCLKRYIARELYPLITTPPSPNRPLLPLGISRLDIHRGIKHATIYRGGLVVAALLLWLRS